MNATCQIQLVDSELREARNEIRRLRDSLESERDRALHLIELLEKAHMGHKEDTTWMTKKQIKNLNRQRSRQIQGHEASLEAQTFWREVESLNRHQPECVSRILDELTFHKATLEELHTARVISESQSVVANIYFMLFLRAANQ